MAWSTTQGTGEFSIFSVVVCAWLTTQKLRGRLASVDSFRLAPISLCLQNFMHKNFNDNYFVVLLTRILMNTKFGGKNEMSKALQGWITWALIHYN